ncbi:triple tyrosine motif-containing protein, partial [Lachnospiraceae bacterium HCP1S3_D4]
TTSKKDETTSKQDETTSKKDETTSKQDETTSKKDETTKPIETEPTSKEDETTRKEEETTKKEEETQSLKVSYITVSKPSRTVDKGDKVTVKAKATGGAGNYQYKFVVKAKRSTVIKNYSSSAKATWKTGAAGKYSITVYVKDADGKVVTKTLKSFVVNNQLKISSFKMSKASGKAKVKDKIKLKVKATGGSGDFYYRYAYKRKGTSKTVYLGYYANKGTATWKPVKKGTYTLYAYVLDNKTDKVIKKTVSSYKVK